MSQNMPIVVITEEDYDLLRPYMERMLDRDSDMSLAHELNRAVIVKKWAFPKHTIRLNSRVSILDLESNRVREFTIVMPEHANIKENKISVLTPMGTALIGIRKAEEVQWRLPAGLKRLRVLNVENKE